MNYYIMTLFPEMFPGIMDASILGRGGEKGLICWETFNIRDYTLDKHSKVDDYPYGGGAGMVMQAEPVHRCYQAICDKTGRKPKRVIYLTPQGKVFDQSVAQELAREEELVFLCGHYEGIDERVLEEIVTDPISLGDYVLTGGELPAMVMMDAISRLCREFWEMEILRIRRVFLMVCWNILNTRDRQRFLGEKCQRYFYLVTMKR